MCGRIMVEEVKIEASLSANEIESLCDRLIESFSEAHSGLLYDLLMSAMEDCLSVSQTGTGIGDIKIVLDTEKVIARIRSAIAAMEQK